MSTLQRMPLERRSVHHAKMRVHDLEWVLPKARSVRDNYRKSSSSHATDAADEVVRLIENLLDAAKKALRTEEKLATKPRVVDEAPVPVEAAPESKVVLHAWIPDRKDPIVGRCSCGWPSRGVVQVKGEYTDQRLKKSWEAHARKARQEAKA